MKNLTVLTLAIVAVITMLYAGFDAMTKDYTYGPFLIFIGACTAVGVVIDFYNHVQVKIQLRIKKSKVSKLGRF
jgi:hypothetical protein